MATQHRTEQQDSESEGTLDGGLQDGVSYPPETHRYMSWASSKFLHRPTWRPLAWVCYAMTGMIAGGLFSAFFVKIDDRISVVGEIVADPEVLRAVSLAEGAVERLMIEPGAKVSKGDLLARLELDIEESRIEALLTGLERNVALAEAAGLEIPLSSRVETGESLAGFRDAGIRELATLLQSAVRRLRKSLANQTPFELDREQVIVLSRRFRGALAEYREMRSVRAPSSGTLLQYEVPRNEPVSQGQTVALVLPEGARLVARLTVEPRHAANVAVGQPVRHKLEAYPFQRYGLFEGRVLSIEQAILPEQGLVYEVHASIRKPPHLPERLAGEIRLMMGMKGESDIVTGRRTLYDLAMDGFFGQR